MPVIYTKMFQENKQQGLNLVYEVYGVHYPNPTNFLYLLKLKKKNHTGPEKLGGTVF